ncbi:MAG: sugar phosphate isomerase/epimerase [Thermomicrobiales bacterium]|nr:sugar phosphate isomerase/epimerase [Thermomicrobiales bacterium]
MALFGAHAFIWVGDWTPETGGEAIAAAEASGIDVLEIPLLRPDRFEAALHRKQLEAAGVSAICSLTLPPDAHLPAHPERARAFLSEALAKTDAVGARFLGGVLYGNLGTLTGAPPTPGERALCAEVLRDVAAEAAGRGITLGLEPVNRYETYLYNTIADTLGLIDAIGADNVTIHADTYHMNIEEPGFDAPLQAAASRLGCIHLSESDRGVPGQGNVRWHDVFAGLQAIDYPGPLVLESFAAVNPDLAGATCMWRSPNYTSDQLVREGVRFLRHEAEKAGIG